MGATRIVLLPAFYSTVAASHNPTLAGEISRVEEINTLIRDFAAARNLPIVEQELRPLFANQSLREDLTFDGVHLNDTGKQIYRQVVRQVLQQTTSRS